jgi:hypothetical protein
MPTTSHYNYGRGAAVHNTLDVKMDTHAVDGTRFLAICSALSFLAAGKKVKNIQQRGFASGHPPNY